MGKLKRAGLALACVGMMSGVAGAKRAPGEAPDPLPSRPEGDFSSLIQKGDEAAKAKNTTLALAYWRWAYFEQLPELRGKGFKVPVQARHMSTPELKAHLITLIDREYPPEKRAADTAKYTAFGLIPADLDLRQQYLELLTSEVAGFYDPISKALYLIVDEDGIKAPSLMDRMTGAPVGQLEKVALAHELTHALEDQQFDLFTLMEKVKHDDDMAFAISGLVEGSATAMMMLSMMPEAAREPLLSSGGQQVMALFRSMDPSQIAALSGEAFGKAPAILQASLVEPYIAGLGFCLQLLKGEGRWANVDAAYADPPISSEQVLHPEKYLQRAKDPALAVDLTAEAPGMSAQDRRATGTLGELGIRVLLAGEPDKGHSAAEGWDGDGYVVYGEGKSQRLLWLSIWEDEAEAIAFAEALNRQRPGGDIKREGNRVSWLKNAPGLHGWLLTRPTAPKAF